MEDGAAVLEHYLEFVEAMWALVAAAASTYKGSYQSSST